MSNSVAEVLRELLLITILNYMAMNYGSQSNVIAFQRCHCC